MAFAAVSRKIKQFLKIIPIYLHRLGATAARFNAWRKNNKWKFRGLLTLLVVLGIWYSLSPRPETIKIYMTAPGITDLTKEKPVPDPIILQFSDSAAPLQQIGKQVTEGVSLSPSMPGKWIWKSDRELRFLPADDWRIDESYSIHLDKDFFPKHVQLNRYTLSFDTPGFAGEFINSEFYQDPTQPQRKKMVVSVRFTHRVDQADFPTRVKLIMKNADRRLKDSGKDFPYEVSFNKVGNEAYIHSAQVDIPAKEHILSLTIDNGARSERGGVTLADDLETQVTVPGMYSYFRVKSSQVSLVRNKHNDPEQVLLIETTDGVKDDILRANLEVFLLPKDRPADKQHPKVAPNYAWNQVEQIGKDILNISRPVTLTALPAEQEYAGLHSYRIDVPPRRYLFVRLGKGLESVGGYVLSETYEQTAKVQDYPKELEIMGEGGLLSLSGDKKLPIVSRGNEGIYYEIGYVLPEQIQHLVSQTGGDFQNPYFTTYQFTEENITRVFDDYRRLPKVPPGKSQYTSFDFGAFLKRQAGSERSGIFLFQMHGWDFDKRRKTGVTSKRLVMITDLGLLVKEHADHSRSVFVMSINSGQPVVNANIKVLGKNGLPVHSTRTDGRGHALIPDLSHLRRSKTPTAIHVTYGNDMSFIPYDRQDRKLDQSRFDIGGVRQHGEKDALSAYLFSDRGIYRPGDTFHVGMIVKSSNWSKGLADIPLQAVITDPRGLTIKELKFPLSQAGFESVSYATRTGSPTGEYAIKLYLVKDEKDRSLLGSTSIKLEEFLPDRMKISTTFSQERLSGWVHPRDLTARVRLKNLYGTPATARRITASMTLSPYHPVFQKYSAYRFYDPLKADKGFTEGLPEAQTDKEGEAEINLDLERFASASYNVTLRTNGFEAEGGRSVSTERSILVSPRRFLVGVKTDGKLNYVGRNSERALHFIAIDPGLALTAAEDLKIALIEQKYISALVKQDNGTYQYQSVLKEKTLSEKKLAISNKGLSYSLPTGEPGDYMLLLRDKDGVELSKVKFSVAGEANLARNLEKNAELQVKLDKRDYRPGETIKVSIRAPYTGAGLITIERDKVYAFKWFKTGTSSSVQSITLPPGIEGNAYINVSFVRDPGSREIFMSPLSYGVVPFTINRDMRRNKVKLDVPYLIRPGDEVDIGYTVSQPGKIVVFAVDEGILQVANYTTPNPLQHFFRKKALEVDTAQILDLILPEYSVVREVSAAGGGMFERSRSNLNPFQRRSQKPVAFWSGILNVPAGGGKLSYSVPDYFNGSLRFMAVAVSPGSVGANDRKSLARGHFVLSPNTPGFVAPGDEFEISLNVTNNVEGSGKGAKVRVGLQVSEHLQLVDEANHELVIDEGREKTVRYRLKANTDKLGSAGLTFHATGGGKQAEAGVDISVRPAIPRRVDVHGGHVQDAKVEVKLERDMYPAFRERDFTVAAEPLGLSQGILQYLTEYPHLCTEQLVSKVFPLVVLRGREDLGYKPDKARASLTEVVDILRSRQNSEGAFGFWAANSYVSPKQSLYALHFLHEAKRNGFAIPDAMLAEGMKYARQMAEKDIQNVADARVRAYAIYLLTENGQVMTRYLNGMREQMERYYADKWQQDISRAYMAAAYKTLHLDNEAESLMDSMRLGAPVITDYVTFYDSLSRDAQLLYIMSRHFPKKIQDIDSETLEVIVKPLNEGYFNTLSSAYSILALGAYADEVAKAGKLQARLTAYDKDDKASRIQLTDPLLAKVAIEQTYNKLELDAAGNQQPVFYQLTEAGFDHKLPDKKIQQGLEIHREYRNAAGQVVDKVAIGEEVSVHLQIRSVNDRLHHHVAIVDLLPGGFEPVLDASRQQTSQWSPEYMDLREDRVVLYGTVEKAAMEFVYKIKSTNKGRYVVPPVYAEGMYDRKLRYLGKAARITVE